MAEWATWVFARRAAAAMALPALAACGDAAAPDAADPPAGRASERATEIVETDVEAPEVFQVSEEGLWDGRPSLGGVWVAHPDVQDPERVVIRNQENGQFVIGALFRRERDNPGPALQVSSDAAEALAMLAGDPAPLNVTALRREEAAAPAPTEAAAPVAVPGGPAPVAGPAALADAAPVGAEVGALAPAAVETRALDAPAAAPEAPELVAPVDPAVVEAVAATTAAILAAAALPPDAAPPPSGAAPAVDAAAAAPPDAPAPPADLALDRPFIQLGIFSVEANAEATAAAMRESGLGARVVASRSQGQDFWRVLVGPARTEAEREALLGRVRAAGFQDAYAVRS